MNTSETNDNNNDDNNKEEKSVKSENQVEKCKFCLFVNEFGK